MQKTLATRLTRVLTAVTTAVLIGIPPAVSSAGAQTDVIEARQAAFKTLKQSMAEIKDAISSENYAAAANAAGAVLDNAKAVTQLFPAGSYEGDTRAKEKIWENLDDFTQRQQKLIADAETLVSAAESKDKKQLQAAFKQTAKNCSGCHRSYRQLF